jgi:molybdopterin-guanine dinucleotide biosynthesis protein A
VIGLSLMPSLESYFEQGGRSVMEWYNKHSQVYLTEVDLVDIGLTEGSYATNLNTPVDIALLREALSKREGNHQLNLG